MKAEYDFSRARRGPIAAPARGKTRVTIRIDDAILAWFRKRVHAAGGGSYQTLINQALRQHIAREDDGLADTLRRVERYSARRIREFDEAEAELARALRRKAAAHSFLENAARVAAAGAPAMSEDQIQAEIEALRTTRRKPRRAARGR